MYKRGGRNLRRSAPQNGAWHRDYGPPPMGARRTPFLLTSRSSNIRIPPAKRAPDWPHSLRPTSGGKKPQGSKEGEEKKQGTLFHTQYPLIRPHVGGPARPRRLCSPAERTSSRRATGREGGMGDHSYGKGSNRFMSAEAGGETGTGVRRARRRLRCSGPFDSAPWRRLTKVPRGWGGEEKGCPSLHGQA